MLTLVRWTAVLAGLSVVQVSLGQDCQPRWSDEFSGIPAGGSIKQLRTLTISGEQSLYVIGTLSPIIGTPCNAAMRAATSQWVSLGSVAGGVYFGDIGVLNVNGAERLVIAGQCVGSSPLGTCANMVMWSGGLWLPIGWAPTGIDPTAVFQLLSVESGGSTTLYGIGVFCLSPSVGIGGALRWQGSSWSTLTGPIYHTSAFCGAVFDTGSGPTILVGGDWAMRRVEGDTLIDIATIGPPFGPTGGSVAYARSMAVFDDGTGSALYVAGTFLDVEGIAANNIARWTGSSWSALGSGLGNASSNYATVNCLAVFDDGRGPALYAAGMFSRAGGQIAGNIARWDGHGWDTLGGGTNQQVRSLAVFDDGRGPALWVGGDFTQVSGVTSRGIARWVGCRHPCYANCDDSVVAPYLNVNDLMCFMNRFAAGDSYANCDGSTVPPTLNAADFACFLNAYAAGCP